MNNKKPKVLFLCTGNSARSQMAEALLKNRAGEIFDVYSAGTRPEKIDLRAIDALRHYGITDPKLVSKSVDAFMGKLFDFVITLCDSANNECRDFPNACRQFSWDFPDPKTRKGYMPFTATLNEIDNRISMFIDLEGKPNLIDMSELFQNEETLETKLTLEPINFYKNFTDDIRIKTLMLSHYHGELCVCELMEALAENSQPKVSRNLAVLKKANVLSARKHGQWVFYRINPNLPLWAKSVIAQTTENNITLIDEPLKRLANMRNRPSKINFCK